MTPQQASEIVERLALGIDPRTGEVLGEGDACTAPEAIRALFIARNALQGALEAPAAPTRRGPAVRNGIVLANAGKKWSGDDVDTLLREFEAGTPIGDIAIRLGRTTAGIVARLVLAGALPDRQAGYDLIRDGRQPSG